MLRVMGPRFTRVESIELIVRSRWTVAPRAKSWPRSCQSRVGYLRKMVFPELVLQGLASDAKDLGGAGMVAVGLSQGDTIKMICRTSHLNIWLVP